jgi:hypothetical protein
VNLSCNNLYLNLYYGIVYLYVLIVFSLRRESLKLILVDEPLPEVVLSQLRLEQTWGNTLSTKKWQIHFVDEDRLAHIRTIVVS